MFGCWHSHLGNSTNEPDDGTNPALNKRSQKQTLEDSDLKTGSLNSTQRCGLVRAAQRQGQKKRLATAGDHASAPTGSPDRRPMYS